MGKVNRVSAAILAVCGCVLLTGITGCGKPEEAKKQSTVPTLLKIAEKQDSVAKQEVAAGKKETENKGGRINTKTENVARTEREQMQLKAKADSLQYHVLVKKSAFTVYLLDDQNKVIRTYDCTIGKNPGQKEKRGDMKTPTGIFYVDEIDDASDWTHDFGDGRGEIKGAYGPWFISLNTEAMSKGAWGGIGIHGTHKPEAMGIRDSEGCVRLRNENIAELKQYVRVGTKVTIEE